jgi:hypothetical protein
MQAPLAELINIVELPRVYFKPRYLPDNNYQLSTKKSFTGKLTFGGYDILYRKNPV